MSDARTIIDRAGGITQLASDLSATAGRAMPIATVKAWRRRNRIPGAWALKVVQLLCSKGVEIDEILGAGGPSSSPSSENISDASHMKSAQSSGNPPAMIEMEACDA